jgi:hypothetical protein
MKYTALLMIISGALIACFVGGHYASMGPPNWAENPLVLGLVLPLAFAAALVLTGAALWTVGGRGYTASEPAPSRHLAGGSGG